jgi:hypothetical protein
MSSYINNHIQYFDVNGAKLDADFYLSIWAVPINYRGAYYKWKELPYWLQQFYVKKHGRDHQFYKYKNVAVWNILKYKKQDTKRILLKWKNMGCCEYV